MKVDKESFLKHHFWYLLGLLIPLIFLAMILLWTGTAGAIDEYKKKFDVGKTSIEGLSKNQPKNQSWIQALEQKITRADEEKNKIWKQMWETQSDLMTWPAALADKFKDLSFGDKIIQRDRNTYAKDDVFTTQFAPIIDLVQPVNPDGTGVVQCGTGDWYTFLRFKRNWVNTPITTEDIWLAQEDLWLQREMLRIVREANDAAATMKKVTLVGAGKAKDELDRQTYTSPVWKLEIALAQKEGKYLMRYRLTNISRRRQWLGLNFQVGFHGTQLKEKLFVDDEPLAPAKSLAGEQALGFGSQFGNPDGIDSVHQILDWKTAPVKRIDHLEMQWNSARTSATKFIQRPFPQLTGDVTQGASPPGDVTPEGLRRDRYYQVTPQVRRFAIGMLCVVEQDAMQDLLTAFANSRLHVETTQWHWQRFYGDIRPAIQINVARGAPKPQAPPVAAPAPSGVSEDAEGDLESGAGRRRGRGAAPPAPAPTPASPGRAIVADDRDMELVQLAVYGIASLYERYPSRPTK